MFNRRRTHFLPLLIAVISLPMIIMAGPVHASPQQEACKAFAKLEGRPDVLVARATPSVAGVAAYLDRAEALGFSGGIKVSHRSRTLLQEAYGFADKGNEIAMPTDAVFDIGSVAKPFTAASILRLEDMGRLRVEDRITRFFGDAVPPDKRAITIHQLLTHSAGLPLHSGPGTHYDLLERDKGIARILALQLENSPGKTYQYSNPGFILLAAIVEIASGRGYEQFLSEELLRPAGLRQTGSVIPNWNRRQFALGYNAFGPSQMPPKQWWIADGPSWSVRGAGYILSTTSDLVRWGEALMAGRILSDQSRLKMFHPHIRENSRTPSYYGYGWAISEGPDGTCVIAHDGGAGFHAAVLRIYPAHDLVAATFTSESRSPAMLFMDVSAPLLFNPVKYPLPTAARRVSASELRRVEGDYRGPSGEVLRIERTGEYATISSRSTAALRLLSALPELPGDVAARIGPARADLVAMFEALSRDDYALLERHLRSSTPIAEEKAFWPIQWKHWQQDMGAYRGAEIIGDHRRGSDLITYVHMHFARGSLPVEIFYDASGKIFVNTVSFMFPERTHLLAQEGTEWFAYNARLGSRVRVRLDPSRKTFAIVSSCLGRAACGLPL